ncbi:uncharacterized protein STEHIDRAFT_94494 [Stereum hirsutum FP-91666 SS1]|uniref:uncharacterized protein n=1 Tax=Stereum hirsutum (strain FP-91666) TaxID=721885 RepID=UPI000440D016|nr:uncharacterized protein STEHIDRAFT_94494 [Stereum hirsutum FP-91666 SS1]EIM89341.1 hypothetical protein STEHIDRAFT_94494 [Stereum hirsutum FP-91666 SS1]
MLASGPATNEYYPPSSATFDPAIHLAYTPPASKLTMSDIGLPSQGISPIAVTEPFSLMSVEGVRQLRQDILSTDVLEKYTVASKLAACQSREFPKTVTPFVHQVWKHPEVLRIVSEAAGIELEPVMDLELGHVNHQLGPKGKDGIREISGVDPRPTPPALNVDQLKALSDADLGSSEQNVVGWHYDSYPFVCVLMLSDVSNMIGGETAVRRGDGGVTKVRGPGVGSAVVMQGRHVRHVALRSYNAAERITMVTSFRAKDPRIMDASVLTTIHPITKRNRINYQWSLYRLKLLSERFAATARDLELAHAALPPDDDKDGLGGSEVVKVEEMEKWIREQVGYLERTGKELAKTVEKESGDAYLNMTGPGTVVSVASANIADKVMRGRMWGVGAGVLLCVFGAAQWALS